MAITGNWIFCKDPKKLHPNLSEKELKDVNARLKEVVQKSFKNNPTLKKFGWNNDGEEFKNRWQIATHKNIDLHQPNMSDIDVFKAYMKGWTKSIEKGYKTAFHSWKLLPQKLKKLPGGDQAYRNVLKIQSYERRHKQNAQMQLGKIQKEMKILAGKKHFDVDTSILAKLESAIMSTTDKAEVEAIYNKIQEELGSKGSIRDRERAGDLAYGIADVMEGADVQSLRKSSADGKSIPWTAAEKEAASHIQNAWISTRKDLAVVAINALRLERDFAKRLDIRENHARGLEKHLDTIESKIKELELTMESTDKDRDRRYDLNDKQIERLEVSGKRLRKGYMPHQILTLIKHLDVFHDWMEADRPSYNMTANEKFKDLVLSSDRSFIERLKSRGEVAEEYYSRNPLFFVSQYIHDITRYNYKRSMETVLADVFDKLLTSKKHAERESSVDKEQVLHFIDEAMDTLHNIAEESLVTDSQSNNRARKLSRFATTLGFIRTMAYNNRSPLRNYTQKFFEYVNLGFRAPREARAYIQGNKEIETARTDAMERHGLYWKTDDSFIKELTSTYNKAAATRGTEESSALPPGMAEINGKIMIVNETMFDKTLRVLDKVADIGAWGHRKVEDVIRAHAFTTSYGLSHKNLSALPEWFINKEMGRKSTTEAERKAWINRAAGELSYGQVIDIHYEYSKLQKPDIIKGPVGSVIGQYKQYRFSNIDMQENWIRAGLRRIKSGGIAEYEAIRLYRLGIGYSLVSGLTAAVGLGFTNLFQNDTYEWMKGYWDYWTADRSTPEGKKQAKKALYGKGELGELGPTFGAFIEAMEIFNIMRIDHSHRLAILGITSDISPVENINDMDRNYRLARLVNLQGARTWYHTRESFLNKNYWKAFLTETGLYASSDDQESSDTFMGLIRDVTGTKTYISPSQRRERERIRKQVSPHYAAAIKSIDQFLKV